MAAFDTVQLIFIPYDSGYRNIRMGKGPLFFLNHGIEEEIRQLGLQTGISMIEIQDSLRTEITMCFKLNQQLAIQISEARKKKRFPLTFSGNCQASMGHVAGFASDTLGVIWFDAHADFNTPETSTSGFLDGMALSMLTGNCWNSMALSITGFKPVPESHVILAGLRDQDKQEKNLLEKSAIRTIEEPAMKRKGLLQLEQALQQLKQKVNTIYLHIDLDVIDPKIARANHLTPAGGLSVEHLLTGITLIKQYFSIAGVNFASFDPVHDGNNILKATVKIIGGILKN